jgi:hypothetical protein
MTPQLLYWYSGQYNQLAVMWHQGWQLRLDVPAAHHTSVTHRMYGKVIGVFYTLLSGVLLANLLIAIISYR